MADTTQRLEQNDSIRSRIAESKSLIRTELTAYSQAVKSLKDAAKKKADAERRYDRRQNDKNAAAAAEATSSYNILYENAAKSLFRLEKLISSTESDWEQLIWQIGILDARSAPREMGEFERYKRTVYSEKKRTDDQLADSGITITPFDDAEPVTVSAEVNEEAVDDSLDSGVAEAAQAEPLFSAEPAVSSVQSSLPPAQARPSVGTEAVRIDISSHVERVVGIAMDKLSAALEKRIDSYFATYVPNIPNALGNAAGGTMGTETAALAEKIADDERALLDKLVGIVEVLKKLNTDMAAISAAYALIDAKNKEIIELQKESNDMQRHTLREQQGVQVNQRVVNTDQLKITEAQVSMISMQKKAAEDQARALSSQTSIAQSQRAVLDTQASIEEAMQAVIAEQRRIIEAQQAIIAENARQLEASGAVAASQTEVLASQKELMSSQRQNARDQRSVADKQRETADLQTALTADVKDILKDARAVKVKKTPKSE
jgi:hypothetical protein